MLAHNCWEELRSQSESRLTSALVQKVFRQTINGLDPMFAHTWSLRSSVQQRTLMVLLRDDGHLNAMRMVRSAGLSNSSFKSALRWLHEHGILRDYLVDRKFNARFADPFFAQWIRIHAKL
jgi:uncharacterized membrane protein